MSSRGIGSRGDRGKLRLGKVPPAIRPKAWPDLCFAQRRGSEVRKLYGVPNTLELFPGRVTYVIDEEGVVKYVFSSQLYATGHVEQALKALESID